jgi:molybdopterin-guanine dinucleotide biosynthesis protein
MDKRLILIGAPARNTGKTTLATELIRLWKDAVPITALKVTTIGDHGCPHGDAGCGACSLTESEQAAGFALMRESGRSSGRESERYLAKDTMRLLAAGAEQVFWLRSMRTHLAEGYARFLEQADTQSLIICESNSLRETLEPALFIMLKCGDAVKASAARVAPLAQISVTTPLDTAVAHIAGRVTIERDAHGCPVVRLR